MKYRKLKKLFKRRFGRNLLFHYGHYGSHTKKFQIFFSTKEMKDMLRFNAEFFKVERFYGQKFITNLADPLALCPPRIYNILFGKVKRHRTYKFWKEWRRTHPEGTQ